MRLKLLIFIITYNSSFRLKLILKKIQKIKKINYKILISDDCSTDDTSTYIPKENKKVYANINNHNLGYCGNIKKCINFAIKKRFHYEVMIHGDNQYDPKYINNMIDMILYNKKTAAVYGSRMFYKKNAIKGGMPIYKFIGNIILTKIFNLFFNTRFTDCHSGFWFYNLSFVKKINLKKIENNFNFDNQLRINLIKKKFNILEIPIQTYYGTEKSSMHFLYALRFLFDILKNKL